MSVFGVYQLIGEILAAVLVVRVLAGVIRTVRWAPEGDGKLVAAMDATRPRLPSRVACAVIDRSAGTEQLCEAFNRCDQQTVFEIGSVTKALTGLLIADAIDRGELSATSTVGQSWPELSERPVASATIDQLTHHRSGLPGSPLGMATMVRLTLHAYLGLDPYRGLHLPAVLRIARRARLNGVGAERYSNLGAALAGHTVARRAGTSYADLLTERVIGPTGMSATSADPRRARNSGHGRFGAWAQPWHLDGYTPAGAVTSTLHDLTQLCRRLLDGTCPGGAALDEALFWQIHTAKNGYRRIWHNGQTGGYSAYLAVYPEARKAVIVLAACADAAQQERLAAACVNASGRSNRDAR